MTKLLGVASCLATIASTAVAKPSGRFRQVHEVSSGSSLDPIPNGRFLQSTEKVMSRLVRPDITGLPSPDLAVTWSANQDLTEWRLKLSSGVQNF
jgi:peptide/nickel transport system substrate-binding protein